MQHDTPAPATEHVHVDGRTVHVANRIVDDVVRCVQLTGADLSGRSGLRHLIWKRPGGFEARSIRLTELWQRNRPRGVLPRGGGVRGCSPCGSAPS
jgi:hypothetical protein